MFSSMSPSFHPCNVLIYVSLPSCNVLVSVSLPVSLPPCNALVYVSLSVYPNPTLLSDAPLAPRLLLLYLNPGGYFHPGLPKFSQTSLSPLARKIPRFPPGEPRLRLWFHPEWMMTLEGERMLMARICCV